MRALVQQGRFPALTDQTASLFRRALYGIMGRCPCCAASCGIIQSWASER
jgi:hypothetical protein